MRSLFLVLFVCLVSCTHGQAYFLFIGTYTGTGSKGIYVYRFDAATGKASWISNTEGVINPSFIAVAPGAKRIYACTETRTVNAGSISAFSFDRVSGRLSFINKQSSGGDNPVYVSVHKHQHWVVAGNYSGGSLSALKINEDGSLRPFSQRIQHQGRGVDTVRQTQSHVHSVVFSPDFRFLLVPDLGLDKVLAYRFQEYRDKPLEPAPVPFVQLPGGSGPRHLAFLPGGNRVYLAEEMKGEVTGYAFSKGLLHVIDRVSTHPDTLKPPYGTADIHASPDGKFLYVSNRANENNIAIFSISTTGKLKLVGYEPARGKTPRNFTIDPTGNFLLVANQDSDNITIFKRDKRTGFLHYTGDELHIPSPVCLQIAR